VLPSEAQQNRAKRGRIKRKNEHEARAKKRMGKPSNTNPMRGPERPFAESCGNRARLCAELGAIVFAMGLLIGFATSARAQTQATTLPLLLPSSVVFDAAGNLYGTTSEGGANGNGTVFKLAAPKTKGGSWTESVLYSFGTGTDGSVPVGGVSFGSAGNLYGTTSAGGAYGFGTVFQLVAGSGWTENILYDFQNANDGAVPYAGLISDKAGNFYGAATEGGANGGGTVFELTSSKGDWTFNVLYSVPGWGISGTFRNVVLDASGNLYATTHCDGEYNSGTVYELTPSRGAWTYTLLYTFTGGTDGLYSVSNPVLSQNKIYGTTLYGGADGNGVVYEVTP